MLPSIRFQSLHQAPEHAGELAHWLHLERTRFGAAGTEAEGLAKLRAEWANPSNLAQTHIALAGNRLLGAATLMTYQGPLAQPGEPWLGNLWVHPKSRKNGLGRALCQHLIGVARAQNFPQLQLFTYDQTGFYLALGWREVRRAKIAGRTCTIMAFAL